MIQHGTVIRFGNRGFGFVKLDCDHQPLGNHCREHERPVFIHSKGMRFTEPGMRGTRFHPNPEFARDLLPDPNEGDRLVMSVTEGPRGLVGVLWTFESLWMETDRLVQQRMVLSLTSQISA